MSIESFDNMTSRSGYGDIPHQAYLHSGPVRKSWHFVPKYLNRYLDSGHLDIGCGSGGFLDYVQGTHSRYGIDLDRLALNCADIRIPKILFYGGFEENAARLPKVRAVSCFEVIEHISDPLGFLQRVYDFLPSESVFFGSVPNKSRFWARCFGKEEFDFPPNHLQFFDEADLFRLLSEAGFRNVSVLSAFLWPSIGDVAYRLKQLPIYRYFGKIALYFLFAPVFLFLVFSNLSAKSCLHLGFYCEK